MVSRAAVDFSSSWFDWFVRNRPTDGNVLTGGPNGTLSWSAAAAGTPPTNMIYASDYATFADAAAASIEVGKVLILNKSFTLTANGDGAGYSIVNDNVFIKGIGRGLVALTAGDACANGVLYDKDGMNVHLEGFTLDGGSKANTVGLAVGPDDNSGSCQIGCVSDMEIQNCPASAVRIRSNSYFWQYRNVRMVDGNTNYGVHFDGTALTTAGDNGQTSFIDCDFATGHECVIRTGITSTFRRIAFVSCQFLSSDDGDHIVDLNLMHSTGLFGCDIECSGTHMPGVSVVNLNGYGQGLYNTSIFCQSYNNVCTIIDGSTSYEPYVALACHIQDAGANVTGFDSCKYIGAESTTWQNFSGTKYSSTEGLNFATINNAQPTLELEGQVRVWEDSDGGPKRYLIGRVNGVDYKVEIV